MISVLTPWNHEWKTERWRQISGNKTMKSAKERSEKTMEFLVCGFICSNVVVVIWVNFLSVFRFTYPWDKVLHPIWWSILQYWHLRKRKKCEENPMKNLPNEWRKRRTTHGHFSSLFKEDSLFCWTNCHGRAIFKRGVYEFEMLTCVCVHG